MLSITRFDVPPPDRPEVLALAQTALAAFAGCDGYRGGSFAQNLDERDVFALITDWDGVGVYRRAMGRAGVKLAAYPLLLRCRDEPSAFAAVLTAAPGEPVLSGDTDLNG